jgi:hypothetical protein
MGRRCRGSIYGCRVGFACHGQVPCASLFQVHSRSFPLQLTIVLNILESGKTLLLIIIARIMPEPGSWINRRPRFWQRDLEKMTLFHHHFKLRFFPTHSALRSVVLFFALSGVAAAKNQLQIDLGVRGGTFNSGIPIEVKPLFPTEILH